MSTSRAPTVDLLAGLPPRSEITRLLGRGQQKSVYLAVDGSLDRQVAIAAIDTSAPDFPDAARLQEARTMARLGDHPHITSIYDVIEGPGALYIVSRYVAGGDLQTHLRERGTPALPVAQAVRIAAQVCRALEHVHELGIAHRDVKPSNIFLDERGNAVLGDFGLADAKANSTEPEFVGTPTYVAPEQIYGECAASSDLYSLGCVLCELSTGAPPFSGRNGYETIQLHLHAEPVSARARNPVIPLALDDLIKGLLAKDPKARPGSSRDVRAALEGILAGVWSAVAISDDGAAGGDIGRRRGAAISREHQPLVGRDEDRSVLRRLATHASSGVPGVLFLEGEAGIGKSRLLHEFRMDAEDRGAVVLLGHAYQDAPVPYRPIVEALLPLAARLSGIDPRDAELVRRLLYLDHRALDTSEPVADKTGRQRLMAALFHALIEFCRSRPIVIVLDDLHWADSASIDLLEHLIMALGARAARTDVKLALVAGLRPVEPDHPVGRLLTRVRGEVICEARVLDGLAKDAVYHVLRGRGIERPSDQLVDTVYRVTEGNPLFIGEVVDHLRRQGALHEQRGFTVSRVESTDIAMPTSMTAVIDDRIREISPACHEVLILGAFLGPGFPLATLAGLAEMPDPSLAGLLDEAVAAGLLLEDSRTYRFVHPLVRQALYQEPRAIGRQGIHLRIADSIERAQVESHETATLEIAHHLMRAGPAADAVRVARCTADAADGALQSFAWHEAASLFEAAIAAAARGADLPPARLAELHRRAGIAYFNRFDAGPCMEHLERAVDLYGRSDDATGLARALNDRALIALQLGLVGLGELQETAPLQAALARLAPEQRSLRARILATLSESHWTAQDAGQAVLLAEQAMQLARADGNDSLCADISVQLSLAHMQHLDVDQALASYDAGIAHARRANHLSGLEQCLQRQAVILCMSGRFHEAEGSAAEARELNEIVHSAVDASWTSYLLLTLAALRGDHEAAERHGAAGIELLRRGSYPWSGAAHLSALAFARTMRDDSAGAKQALDLLLEPGLLFDDVQPIAIFAHPYRELIRAYAGLPVDPDVLQGAPMMEVSEAGFDFSMLPYLAAWVDLGAVLDPPCPLPHLVAALTLAAERGVVYSAGWPFMIPRILGVAAAAEARWQDAARYFEQAIGLARGAGATPELLRAQIDYAQALTSRNQANDRARAQRLVEQSLPRVDGSCPRLVRDRAAALAATLAADAG
jgi:tetratricopeptide (TPR) repeat protein